MEAPVDSAVIGEGDRVIVTVAGVEINAAVHRILPASDEHPDGLVVIGTTDSTGVNVRYRVHPSRVRRAPRRRRAKR